MRPKSSLAVDDCVRLSFTGALPTYSSFFSWVEGEDQIGKSPRRETIINSLEALDSVFTNV